MEPSRWTSRIKSAVLGEASHMSVSRGFLACPRSGVSTRTAALTAALVAALAGGAVSAQSQQTPVFRSTTALLVVDVSVLDEAGRPVPNLTAADFQVKLDGRLRPVKAVTYAEIEGPASNSEAGVQAPPTRTVTNVALTSPQHRVVLILVDDLSLSPTRGKSMLAAAARFVRSLPETDLVGFTTTSWSASLNPTLDHALVERELPRIVGEFEDPRQLNGPPVSIEEAVHIRDGDSTALNVAILRDCFNGTNPQNATTITNPALNAPSSLLTTSPCAEEVSQKVRGMGAIIEGIATRQFEAYREVIAGLKNAPGLKQLVLISDGVAVSRRSDGGASQLEPIARAAAASGVQVSVLSEEAAGVDISEIDRSYTQTLTVANPTNIYAELRRSDDEWTRSGIQTIADMTGGTFYQVIGTPDSAFAQVARASSALYQLGVEAPSDGTVGEDYALSVSVSRRNVSVHANRHAFGPTPAAAAEPIDQQLEQVIATGAPHYAVPLSIGTVRRAADSDLNVDLDIDVDVPGSVHPPLTVVFGLGDRSSLVRSGRTTITTPAPDGDYRASITLPIPTGDYRLRFAVADGDHNIGSVETAIAGGLNRIGPFLASDVITGWVGANREPKFLALERVPEPAKWLLSALELYPIRDVPVPSDVQVRMALMSSDRSAVSEEVVVPSRYPDDLRADGQFDIQNLTPGLYTLRATVLASGQPLGYLTTTVRVGPTGAD